MSAVPAEPLPYILGETFHSQAALRHGDHVAKRSVVPVSPGLTALTGVSPSCGTGR